MTALDLILAVCTALAAIGGFVFEWRRKSGADEVAARVSAIEGRVVVLEQWRDRIGRTW